MTYDRSNPPEKLTVTRRRVATWFAWMGVTFLMVSRNSRIVAYMEEEGDSECSICRHDIARTQRMETICGHTFHRHCLAIWMRTYAFCPDCPRRM